MRKEGKSMFLNSILSNNINIFTRNSLSNYNSVINSSAVNRSIANKIGKTENNINGSNKQNGQINKRNDRDTVLISAQGRKQSIIEQLMKQKQDIIERKNEVKISADEKGYDVTEQLKAYEEQIKQIDEQISQIQSEEANESNDNKIDLKSTYKQEQKTEEEIQNENLTKISNIAISNELTEIVSNVKNQIDNRVNILETELKLDASRGLFSEEKIEEISELKAQSSSVSNDIGEMVNDTNKSLNEINNEYSINDYRIKQENENIQEQIMNNRFYSDVDENMILGEASDPDRAYIEQIMPDKIRYNMKYICNRSVKEYFKIIFLTFWSIIR